MQADNCHPLARPTLVRLVIWLCIALLANTAMAEPSSVRALQLQKTWLPPIVNSFVERPFGARSCESDKVHRGADIVSNKSVGVVAPADGFVIVAAKSDPFFPGLKNLIVIDHGDHITSVYANLGEQLVQTGERVRRGQRIGMTQDQQKSITHVELHIKGKAIDPFKRMPYVFYDLQLDPPN